MKQAAQLQRRKRTDISGGPLSGASEIIIRSAGDKSNDGFTKHNWEVWWEYLPTKIIPLRSILGQVKVISLSIYSSSRYNWIHDDVLHSGPKISLSWRGFKVFVGWIFITVYLHVGHMFLLGRCGCVHLDEALQTIKKSQLIFPEGSYKLTLNLSFPVNLVTSK